VIVKLPEPTPFWAEAFVGSNGMILPKHAFGLRRRQLARRAGQPEPIGTGPYKFTGFKPGDSWFRRDQHRLPHGQPAAISTASR
jgi:peptide/nickel transport system substrate-binding protein